MKKFNESLDTAVLTTKYVVEGNYPILYVYHFEDGSWQFNGEQKDSKDEDYVVISLREVLSIDLTVVELAGLPLGHEAMRGTKNEKWQIVSVN